MFKKLSVDKSYPYILIIAGVIGIASSFFLSVDKFKILQNEQTTLLAINPYRLGIGFYNLTFSKQ